MDDSLAKRQWLEVALGVRFQPSVGQGGPATTTEPAMATDQEFPRSLERANAVWRGAVETVDDQINQVRAKMLASGVPDLLAIADRGLPALTNNHKTPVMAAILDIGQLSGDARKAVAARGLEAIADFRQHIGQSEIVKILDEQSHAAFGIRMTIREEIGRGLDALEPAFKSAASA
jgi:hypothetical protein